MVMVCGALEVPWVVVPGKVNGFAVLNVATGAGAGGATAMPEREMVCGLVGEFPVIVTMALPLPALAGEYIMESGQEICG